MMEIIDIEVGQLVHDPQNPRKHNSDNVTAIKKSIQEHGQVEPLVVQKSTKMVIAGNARLKVMKDLGFTEVKVALIDVDDTQARKLSISLNRSGELATWNESVLAKHLEELALATSFDPESLGFSNREMNELVAAFGGAIESLDFDDVPEEPTTERSTYTYEDDEDDSFDDSVEDFGNGVEDEAPAVSNVRMVQMFLNDETIGIFQDMVKYLGKHYGTTNITDTVFKAVEEQYNSVG